MSGGNCRIDALDLHVETGPGGPVPVDHRFRSDPPAHQVVARVGGAGLLREGDGFRNEASPDHRAPKRKSSFLRPPSGVGRFTRAGQGLLRVLGRPVACTTGSIETCSDGIQERLVRTTTSLRGRSLLRVRGSAALTGRIPSRS